MSRNTNAYSRMKANNSTQRLLDKEETYFAGACLAVLLIPFVSVIDGGIGIAVAYGARKLYKNRTGK